MKVRAPLEYREEPRRSEENPPAARKVKTGTVAVLVVSYFSADSVGILLKSLASWTGGANVEVSVVDNSTDDVEFAHLSQVLDGIGHGMLQVRLVQSKVNLGYAGGNNLAWSELLNRQSNVDVVVVANPDVDLTGGSMENLIQIVCDQPPAIYGVQTVTGDLLQSGLGAIDRRTGRSRQLAQGELATRNELTYPGGHFLVAPVAVWRSLNGLSEDFFLYMEETDFALRASKAFPKITVRTTGAVALRHLGGLTTGSGNLLIGKSKVTFRQGTRSRIILFRKHPSLRRFLPVMSGVRVIWSLQILGGTGYPSARAIWQGIADGFAWREGTDK